MPSPFHVEVSLPIPADLFWSLRASRQFTSYLVTAGALNRLESSQPRLVAGDPSRYTRVQTYVPATMEIPDIIKPIIDESYIEVCDTQTWDVVAGDELRQSFNIRTSIMADLVKTSGFLFIKAPQPLNTSAEQAHDTCHHVISGECCVSIPILGWYAEQAIISNIKNFYKDYPTFVQGFADMVMRRWGDNNSLTLRDAIERMLVEEKVVE